MTNSERAAYIRGLMEGMELDQSAKETKIFNAMLELFDGLCLATEEFEENLDLLSDKVDEIDEDLGAVETDLYDLDDDCSCGHHHHDDEDDFDGEYFEVTCPNCDETIQLGEEILDQDSIDCPNCGETLEFDFDEIEDVDCDCEGCSAKTEE